MDRHIDVLDLGQAGRADHEAVRAPAVPLYVDVNNFPTGSKLGGIFISSIFGYPSFLNAHVKG